MKISIVTAVYNRNKTIGMAIASLRAQSHNNVEHIVVDGGSTDGTIETLTALARSNMHVVSEPDEGIYDALNKGFARATGNVIGLLHSDDFYADGEVLRDVATIFANEDIDAVYGDLDYVSHKNTKRVVRRWQAGAYSSRRLASGWMPPHPTLFVRRSVIERLGAFNTRYQIAADYDAVLRWFGQGAIHSEYIPRVLVKMRTGGASNRSAQQIIRKTKEDYFAMRSHHIKPLNAIFWKNLSKAPQFFYAWLIRANKAR